MSFGLSGKIAFVTGGASGIGRGAAVALAKQGAFVFVADLRRQAAEEAAMQIAAASDKAESIALDVSREEDWARAIERVVATHGKLDILINSAGVSFATPLDAMSLADWRRVMAVNLDGVFLGTRAAIQAMQRTGGGSIVNVASVSGIKPSPTASAYCASKAAVRMLTKVAAIECADAKSGIRVNLVTPAGVKTPMWESMEFFQALAAEQGGAEQAYQALEGTSVSQRFFTAEEVAETILYLASDDSKHLTGTEIVLDRGHH